MLLLVRHAIRLNYAHFTVNIMTLLYKNLVEFILNLLVVIIRFSGRFQAESEEESIYEEGSDFLHHCYRSVLPLHRCFCLAVFRRHTYRILPRPRSCSPLGLTFVVARRERGSRTWGSDVLLLGSCGTPCATLLGSGDVRGEA
jgi:hypothetical protein